MHFLRLDVSHTVNGILLWSSFLFSFEDFCHRGSSGNTVHGTFVVISPQLWSNIMTITCVVLWLVRILHLLGESVKIK